MINFSQSYLTWETYDESRGRFDIESICSIDDRQNKIKESFCGLSGVMACDVYGESPLFYSPSFHYQAMFSESHVKIMRSFYPEQDKDTFQAIGDKFSSIKKEICYLGEEEKMLLENFDEINDVVINQKPLVGQVNIETNSLAIELVFPVRHINTSVKKQMFQVETGSVLMINLDKGVEKTMKSLVPAFVSFNNFKEIDFLLYDTDYSNTTVRRYYKPLHVEGEVKLWTY